MRPRLSFGVQRQLQHRQRAAIGAAQGEAAAVRRRHPPDDGEPVAVALSPGEPRDRLARRPPARRRAGSAAGVGDDDPHPPLIRTHVDRDPRAAVLDRVDDQVVERLRELDPVAADERVAGPPAQPQRAAAEAGPRAPAPRGRIEQRPQLDRLGRQPQYRPPVDLAVESLQRRRGEPHRALQRRRRVALVDSGEGDRLQRPAQLVQRLVERAAATAGAHPLGGGDGRHRRRQRPAGERLRQLDHPSRSR